MILEKVLMIDGNVVKLEFESASVIVYRSTNYDDDTQIVLYFVDKKSEKVLFKQDIRADCSQNTGYISDLDFTTN